MKIEFSNFNEVEALTGLEKIGARYTFDQITIGFSNCYVVEEGHLNWLPEEGPRHITVSKAHSGAEPTDQDISMAMQLAQEFNTNLTLKNNGSDVEVPLEKIQTVISENGLDKFLCAYRAKLRL